MCGYSLRESLLKSIWILYKTLEMTSVNGAQVNITTTTALILPLILWGKSGTGRLKWRDTLYFKEVIVAMLCIGNKQELVLKFNPLKLRGQTTWTTSQNKTVEIKQYKECLFDQNKGKMQDSITWGRSDKTSGPYNVPRHMLQEEAALVYMCDAGKDREGATFGMTHRITVSRSISSGLVTARHSLSGVSWVLDCEYTLANRNSICLLIKQFINSFVSHYVTWWCPLLLKQLPGGLPWGEYVMALN